ncbi:MAG: HAD-IA family hydrolase [Deltaproteobacteria bacterium]|jgi:2-phosphoglycolate phosphatase|nr:HAD-IA family hydrolase [Deltaproteobacteria bacterium]
MAKIELVIFDLDGTLIDSAPDIVDTTNKVLIQRGRPALPESEIISAIGQGLKELLYSCFPDLIGQEEEIAKLDREFYKIYRKNLVSKTTVFAGVREFLDSTNSKVAIVTNKYEDLALESIGKLELGHYPWVKIFGADSLPERKPHPLPLLEVMRNAGIAAENTVMVGDGLPDMAAARAAGVHALACEYGYCAAEKLENAGASARLRSPWHLAEALEAVGRLAPRNPA